MKSNLRPLLAALLFAFAISGRSYGADFSSTCLNTARFISRAGPAAFSRDIPDPAHFPYAESRYWAGYNWAEDSNQETYAEYYMGSNPDPKTAYESLLRAVKASVLTIDIKNRDFISRKDALVADTKRQLYQGPNEVLADLKTLDSFLQETPYLPTKHLNSYFSSIGSPSTETLIDLACLTTPTISFDCHAAVEFLYKQAHREKSLFGDTIFSYLHEQALSDPTAIRNMIVAAKALVALEIDFVESGKIPSKDVHSILSEAFRKQGHSEFQARRWASWVLAVYSLRGAEWYDDILTALSDSKEANVPIAPYRANFSTNGAVSIMAVTSAIQFFDKVTYFHSGRQFSLPSSVKTSCFYGKPYHFWLAAYMSSLAQPRFGDKSAIIASHLFSVGYELARFTGDGYDQPRKSPLLSNANNAVRLDLVFGSSGAWFGVHQDDKETLNIDELLEESFNRAGKGWYPEFIEKRYPVPVNFFREYAPHSQLKFLY